MGDRSAARQSGAGGQGPGHQSDAARTGRLCDRFCKPVVAEDGRGDGGYADLRKQISGRLSNEERGPNATAEAILRIVDAENLPLRFAVAAGMLPRARAAYAERLAAWEAWEAVSNAAQGKAKNRNAAI